jgi:hypothetical protein
LFGCIEFQEIISHHSLFIHIIYLREGNGDGGYMKEVEFRKFLSKQYVLNLNQKDENFQGSKGNVGTLIENN